MPSAEIMTDAVYYGLGFVTLMAAVWVVTLRSLFRAALCLGLVLAGVAGFFLLLHAEFLAFIQILVYVGAILTLVVFAIMMTERMSVSAEIISRRRVVVAGIVSASLFACLSLATQKVLWPHIREQDVVSTAAIGQQFVTVLVLPFEVISLVFVAVLVGAIAIAAKPKSSKRSA